MFGTIRKHQTWLWMVIITLTIISFVFFFSPYSKMNDGGRGRNSYGQINGQRISEQDYVKASREVQLHYFLMYGNWPEEDKRANFDPLREGYQWLLLIQKQEQMGIYVSSEEAAQVAHERLVPFKRMGVDSPAVFVSKVLTPRGLTVEDFDRYCRHFLGLQQLVTSVGVSGKLVTPQEAKDLYERENQELSTEVVFFSASNYLASATINPLGLGAFYTNSMAKYRVPERLQVNYVKFSASNFQSQASSELKTNLEQLVEANYQRMGTNMFPDAKSPAEAKAKLREEILRSQALGLARRKALDFANQLYEAKAPTPEALPALAKANGLSAQVSAPFDREEAPAELQVGAEFAKAAFGLKADAPYGGPVVGKDGVYVLSLFKKTPSQVPPLEAIREQVGSDYKHAMALSLARQAGLTFYPSLTNGLAQHKSFASLCSEAHLKAQPLPAFSLSTRSLPEVEEQVNLNALKQAAFGTPVGQASAFQATADGGMILFVKAKLPLDQVTMQASLPKFITDVRRSRQEEAFQLWFRHEVERGLRDTPAGQPKPAPSMTPGPAKS